MKDYVRCHTGRHVQMIHAPYQKIPKYFNTSGNKNTSLHVKILDLKMVWKLSQRPDQARMFTCIIDVHNSRLLRRCVVSPHLMVLHVPFSSASTCIFASPPPAMGSQYCNGLVSNTIRGAPKTWTFNQGCGNWLCF